MKVLHDVACTVSGGFSYEVGGGKHSTTCVYVTNLVLALAVVLLPSLCSLIPAMHSLNTLLSPTTLSPH